MKYRERNPFICSNNSKNSERKSILFNLWAENLSLFLFEVRSIPFPPLLQILHLLLVMVLDVLLGGCDPLLGDIGGRFICRHRVHARNLSPRTTRLLLLRIRSQLIPGLEFLEPTPGRIHSLTSIRPHQKRNSVYLSRNLPTIRHDTPNAQMHIIRCPWRLPNYMSRPATTSKLTQSNCTWHIS